MKNILVIEDDKKMREGLREILEDERYNVDSVENGQVGLDVIKKKILILSSPILLCLPLEEWRY